MVTCPKCNADVEEDFGLVTCPSCGAQFMVGENGGEEVQSPATQSPAYNESTVDDLGGLKEDISYQIQSDPLNQDQVAPQDEVLTSDSGEWQKEPLDEMATPAEQGGPTRVVTNEKMSSPNMDDLAEFANSAASLGREGLLRFNIYISGIDSADIKQMVREALTDERFLWDANKILSEIKGGQIQLKEITAVKSTIVVQRLRRIPVELRWEQYAIYQN